MRDRSYSLTCEVRGDEQLAVSSITLRWDKDGTEYSRNPTLTFNPLRRDDAGEYRCTSTFSSPYLTGSRTVTQTRTLTVNSMYTPKLCTSRCTFLPAHVRPHESDTERQWWCKDSWRELHTLLHINRRRDCDNYLPVVERRCSTNQ